MEGSIMMYQFMTFNDNTEVVHSDAYFEKGIETVKVYFEKPVYGGFYSAECYLPNYEWKILKDFHRKKFLLSMNTFNLFPTLLSASQEKEVSTMPQIFKIGSYVIYF